MQLTLSSSRLCSPGSLFWGTPELPHAMSGSWLGAAGAQGYLSCRGAGVILGMGLSCPDPVPRTRRCRAQRWLREGPHGDISRVWPRTGCTCEAGETHCHEVQPRDVDSSPLLKASPLPSGLRHRQLHAGEAPRSQRCKANAAPGKGTSPTRGFLLTSTPMCRVLPALRIQSGPAAGGSDTRSCEGRSAAKLSPGFGQG